MIPEHFIKNKNHIIANVILSFFAGVLFGFLLGLRQDNPVLGIGAGVAAFIFCSAVILLIYYLADINKLWLKYLPVCIIITLLIIIPLAIPSGKILSGAGARKIPSQILLQLDRWAFQASLMRITQIILGLASIVCSLLVAMQINTFKARTLKWLAFASALSVGVLSSFGFGEKANNFRTAWRMLNTAVIRYEVAPDSAKLMELIDVYSEAEKVIGDVQFESKDGD